MKHFVLLTATLAFTVVAAPSRAADVLRLAGVGVGPGYHAENDCPTCGHGGGIAGYGGYAGCCAADYPQRCCEDVWAGYCDEPHCHFWARLFARIQSHHGADCGCETAACCPPEYGCNQVKKLLGCNECCTDDACCEEEPSCEAETECCDACGHGGWFTLPSLHIFKRRHTCCSTDACEPSCEAEEECTECCQPCCRHRGLLGWLHRTCGRHDCCEGVCGGHDDAASTLPPAPPAVELAPVDHGA